MVSFSCRTLVAVLGLSMLSSCGLFRELGVGGDDPQWQDRYYSKINRDDAMRLVSTVITTDDSRHTIQREIPQTGEIDTAWKYGQYSRSSHQQMRTRVKVKVLRHEDQEIRVRLRVQREINDDPGYLMNPHTADWKPHDDDLPAADIMLRRLDFLLSEFQGEGEEVDYDSGDEVGKSE